jgi:hypothetical protein
MEELLGQFTKLGDLAATQRIAGDSGGTNVGITNSGDSGEAEPAQVRQSAQTMTSKYYNYLILPYL